MNGDFSRWTRPNAARQNYSEVLLQQARPLSDSDWTEMSGIFSRRSETALTHVIGRTGTPRHAPGFGITRQAGTFRIGAGGYYIDGAWFENEAAVVYDDQGGDAPVPLLPGDPDERIVIFLEGSKRHVTVQEDFRLADPALGGVDTATRLQNAWRVSAQAVTLTEAQLAALIETARCGGAVDLPGWGVGTGGLIASTIPEAELPEDASCLIPPEAGYLSQENQTYLIRIVHGGPRSQARWVWSRENGSVQALLDRNEDGAFVLRGDRDDAALGFVSGGWVEVFDAAAEHEGRAGTLTRITLTDGIATFAPAIGDFDTMVRPRVRRWDHSGASAQGLAMPAGEVELERGIQVRFATGTYNVGDEWIFEARAATGTIAWPPYPADEPDQPIPAMGWGRRRAALALATRADSGISGVIDLRAIFPTLACLEAEDIGFDDTACQIGAETVQEALEVLCRQRGGGLCQITAGSASELVAAVEALPAGRSVRICLRGGQFALAEALVLRGLGHVIVEGTGPHTIVSVADGEAALAFENCASVRVTDLSINGGPVGIEGRLRQKGRLGAITAIDCGDVAVERVHARTRAGRERGAACISTFAASPRGQVLVRDCVMRVGQAQIGVQIVGSRRAVVENNFISPVPAPAPRVRDRIRTDPVLTARIARGYLRFPGDLPHRRGRVRIVPAGGREQEEGTVSLADIGSALDDSDVPFRNRGRKIQARMHPQMAAKLLDALDQNHQGRIADPAEMHAHLRNLVRTAIGHRGTVRIGRNRLTLLSADILALPRDAFVGQGIVIAGPSVDEARVVGNRIDGAVDGIRIAASSDADANPTVWRVREPANIVRSAVVEGNRITLRPVAAQSAAFGVFLGHVSGAVVAGNDIDGPGGALGNDWPRPHFGVHQFGWRGARLSISANVAQGLHYGYAVLGDLSENQTGLWRLRDNGTRDVAVVAALSNGVELV